MSKLSVQAVAGALKKAGFTQIKPTDYYASGFMVRSGNVYGQNYVDIDLRKKKASADGHNLEMANMAEALAKAGYGVVANQRQMSGYFLVFVFETPQAIPQAYLGDNKTPAEIRQQVKDAQFHAERVRLEEKLEAVRKQMATLREQEEAILAEMAAHIGG